MISKVYSTFDVTCNDCACIALYLRSFYAPVSAVCTVLPSLHCEPSRPRLPRREIRVCLAGNATRRPVQTPFCPSSPDIRSSHIVPTCPIDTSQSIIVHPFLSPTCGRVHNVPYSTCTHTHTPLCGPKERKSEMRRHQFASASSSVGPLRWVSLFASSERVALYPHSLYIPSSFSIVDRLAFHIVISRNRRDTSLRLHSVRF